MITVQRNVRSEEILQSSQYVLFVEGKDDSDVLGALLGSRIRVKPLGPSSHIRAAAEAMYKDHPEYYFLIDRDHYNDRFVEKCWKNFPDPATSNLLVWRLRELENYFLIPKYLERSAYLKATPDKLRRVILDLCQERLYFDAANSVIVWIREELKASWIELFTNAGELPTKDVALKELLARPEFLTKKRSASEILKTKSVENKFEKIVSELTGGAKALDYGVGRWQELLKGKGVLPTVVNRCFRVKDDEGKPMQGSDRMNEVMKELVLQPIANQPKDFQELVHLITERVETISNTRA